jgi:hypothetical protein
VSADQVADLARLDEKIDDRNWTTLADLDPTLTDLSARVHTATSKVPAVLAALEEVLSVYLEVRALAGATFPDDDDFYDHVLSMTGADVLGGTLDVVAERLAEGVDGDGIDADAAVAKVRGIVGRAR